MSDISLGMMGYSLRVCVLAQFHAAGLYVMKVTGWFVIFALNKFHTTSRLMPFVEHNVMDNFHVS
jgi:hypothetical protein